MYKEDRTQNYEVEAKSSRYNYITFIFTQEAHSALNNTGT